MINRMARLMAVFALAGALLLPGAGARVAAAGAASYRVVLTWQGAQRLELHLRGPVGTGGKTFHVYNARPEVAGAASWSAAAADRQQIVFTGDGAGVYQCYVHDFSARDTEGSNALAGTAAAVQLFRGNASIANFEVPQQPGNLWTVFALQDGSLMGMGNMTDEADPAGVGTTAESALVPGDLLFGTIPDSLTPGAWSHAAIYAGDSLVIEAASELENVQEHSTADWMPPERTWVRYLRVTTASPEVRAGAVAFARAQVAAGASYDINLLSKQANGDSWYCSELVWAAYLEASDGAIDLQPHPDAFGVYPWEIMRSPQVAVIGGHYEERPRRGWRTVYLGMKTAWDHIGTWLHDLAQQL